MTCLKEDEYIADCYKLVDTFKEKSRFVLGISQTDELTHMQLMKIRCGGLLGMQRVLCKQESDIPDVLKIMQLAANQYGDISEFPFNEIVRDIQAFSHRKKKGN